MTATRYYLNPDGSLRAVESPGRCARYWELWSRREAIDRAILERPGADDLARLREQREEAELRISAHLDVCERCQAWLEECRVICFQAELVPA